MHAVFILVITTWIIAGNNDLPQTTYVVESSGAACLAAGAALGASNFKTWECVEV